MSNIVIAFSKSEVAAGIKKILTQSGYSVQAVCTTGAQALASVNLSLIHISEPTRH